MEIHVGKLIERRLDELGMTKAEFGRRISTSRQNVNSLLRKPSLDTAYLSRICEVLDYDFFHHLQYGGGKAGPTTEPLSRLAHVRLLIELPREHQERLLEIVLGKGRLEFLEQL